MENYVTTYIEVVTEKRTKNGKTVKTITAEFIANCYTTLENMTEFMENLRQVKNALNHAIRRDLAVTVTLGRYAYIDGKRVNRREARYIGNGADIAENEGFYCRDTRPNGGEYDYWVVMGEDLFEIIKHFSDNTWAWSDNIWFMV